MRTTKPNLEVIDRAIRFVAKNREVSAMDALDAALLSKYKHPSIDLLDQYYTQLKQAVQYKYGETPKHFFESFWDRVDFEPSENKDLHIGDLLDFKWACIEAGRHQSGYDYSNIVQF